MLTPTQQDILARFAAGWTLPEIAHQRGCSRGSISQSLQRAYDALGAANGRHALVLALQHQELSLEQVFQYSFAEVDRE